MHSCPRCRLACSSWCRVLQTASSANMRRPNFAGPACCASAGLGEYISGSILFEETLYDKAATGEPFVELMKKQGIIPGIKTDKVCETVCSGQLLWAPS